MKRTLFFLMMFCTYYLAAMYRFLPLMIFCGTEFLTACLSFCLPRFYSRRLCFSFRKKSETAYAGHGISCAIYVKNTGRFPVSRFVLGLGAGYLTDEEEILQEITGDCELKESDMTFRFQVSECGLLRIQAKSVRIYDPFSLFSVQKPLEEEMQIAVFPAERALRIEMGEAKRKEYCHAGENTSVRPGETYHEIRQIREYRTGDSRRHIHWNMSARADELFIKEYGQETDFTVRLFLELKGFSEAGTEKLGRFYSLLYAMVQGFLRYAAQVQICWPDVYGRGQESVCVSDGAQCRKVLLRLYRLRAWQSDLPEHEESVGVKSAGNVVLSCDADFPRREEMFRLDVELAWYLGSILIYQFSAENLEQEIRDRIFVL